MSPRAGRRPVRLVVVGPTRPGARAEVPRNPPPQRNGASPPDLLIVHHPGSARLTPDAMRAAVETVLQPRGLSHRLAAVPSSRDAARSVQRQVGRAIREGCTRIVAAGGDGTIGMVAQCLARRRGSDPPVSLGIIPAGTANILARELGIPMELEEALAVIADAARVVELDAMLVNRRFVFTQIGVGPDALMIRDTPREAQTRLGRFAYVRSFLRRAFRFRPRRFTLHLDGKVIHERAWQIVVANIGTVGAPPFTWGPRIDPTDGTLDLCVFEMTRKRDFGKLFWRALTGRHRRDENTRFYPVRDRATIDSDRPVLVQGDGEIIGSTPLTLRVVPAALRILVAREVEGATLPADAPASSEPSAPKAPGVEPPAGAPAVAQADGDTVGQDVDRMIAQRSSTWPLQGRFSHPIAALEAYDAAIFLRLNNVTFGPGIDKALEAISRFIHYGEGWAVVVLVMLFVDPRKGLEAAVVALPALWATMITVNILLKRVFRRRRPFISFVKARVIGPRPRDTSFPSGHAAAGFAGALLLGMFAPDWAPLFYLFALAVSFSRIYLGVHYPSDVLMGAFSGTILAVAYRALIQMLLAGSA